MKKRIKKVAAKHISVDRRVQREVVRSHVNYLTNEWDDDGAGVIILSEREDGVFFVIDGQHRVMAKKRSDRNYMFHALVFVGATQKDEAHLFNLYNDKRKSVQPYDKYKSYLLSGAEPYVSVEKVLNSHQLQAGYSPTPNTVAAIQSMLWVVNSFGIDALDTTLSVVEEAWGREGDTWQGSFITGVGLLVGRYQADPDKLAQTLKARVPSAWLSKISGASSGGLRHKIADVISSDYNKGLRGNKRIKVVAKPSNRK